MATKRKPAPPRFDYPSSLHYEGGCKVGWHYYDNMRDAERAAEVAKREAPYRAGQGYDFGYCSPGSIEHVQQGRISYAGRFYVTEGERKLEALNASRPLYRVCVP